MKKSLLIGGIVSLVIICTSISLYTYNGKSSDISIGYWNDVEGNYSMASVPEKIKYEYDWYSLYGTLNCNNIDKYIANKDDFLYDAEFYSEFVEYKDAKFYFYDNNYYVSYYENVSECLVVQNCCSRYGYNGSLTLVPTPYDIPLNEGSLSFYADEGINILDYFFDNYDYERACEFYSRLDSEYVRFDDDLKRIYVDGYNRQGRKHIDECIAFDFKNRYIIGKIDDNGSEIIIDGKKK